MALESFLKISLVVVEVAAVVTVVVVVVVETVDVYVEAIIINSKSTLTELTYKQKLSGRDHRETLKVRCAILQLTILVILFL